MYSRRKVSVGRLSQSASPKNTDLANLTFQSELVHVFLGKILASSDEKERWELLPGLVVT